MHRTKRFKALLTLAALSVTPAFAAGQLPWESPHLLSPSARAGVSFMLVDYGLAPSRGLGGSVVWRTADAPRGLGLRFSAAEGTGDQLNLAGGVDVTAPIMRASADFPLDLIWTSGAGLSYGEHFEVAVPLGVAGGRALASPNLWFNPYASARAMLEGRFGENAPGNEVGLGLAIDVGADLAFGRSRRFGLRLAASLGDRHTLAAGLHIGPTASATTTAASTARRP
jgi:hypothetical protein